MKDSAFAGVCPKCGGLISLRLRKCLNCGRPRFREAVVEFLGTIAVAVLIFLFALGLGLL